MFAKYAKTAIMRTRAKTSGGWLYLLPEIFWKIMYLLPLLFIWRSIGNFEGQTGLALSQMLSYTFLSAILADQLTLRTQFSSWLYEGLVIDLYRRPLPIFGQLVADTIGGWIPALLAFSLPMLVVAPLVGVSVIPASLWFYPSLLLCISLGFAIDFIFGCVTIRLKGASWLMFSIRAAITSLLSGSVIPFGLLPFGLDKILIYQPFASLAGAPLSLATGMADPLPILLAQLCWNAILWPLAFYVFQKSGERMMSYGG